MFFGNKLNLDDVKMAYNLFLNREPLAQELKEFKKTIKTITLENFIKTFLLSEEYINEQKNKEKLSQWSNYKSDWEHNYQNKATKEDIYFCFRLLLGRNPNEEEWTGHSGRQGILLKDIVKTYLNSQEFAKRDLLKREFPERIKKVDYDGFSMYAAEDDIAVGRQVLLKNYEPHVSQIFKKVLKHGMSVLDIGANIGYFSMLSASIVGEKGLVTSVEPNMKNVLLIELNKRSNNFHNIQIVQAAANNKNDILVLKNEYSNGTCSSLPNSNSDLFDLETVGSLRLDDIVKSKIDLIKIDVEGSELLALLGSINIIKQYLPNVIMEFSPNRIKDENGNIAWQRLLDIFIDLKYTLSVILLNGELKSCHTKEDVYEVFKSSGVDHIDLFLSHN